MPEHGHLNDVLVILLAAILCVALFQRLRITPVLGYLTAGIVIGPYAAGLIHDPEGTELLAEFGVIFLLFTIGLDLPLRRLIEMRHLIFGLGLAQVGLTSVAIAGVAMASGLSVETALILGGALALSSTATVLQLLIERRELADRHGRLSVAVLLFQDLAVVPLLALLPILAGGSTNIVGALGLAAVKAAIAIGLILLIGRLFLRPVYRVIAETRNPEIFAATNLLIVLATGYATAQAGMSMALGAFLAGLLLADTEYRHQIEADIQPFRGLFLGLFFITVGMSIDLGRIIDNLFPLLAMAVALLAGKAAILYALLRAFKQGHRMAARVALIAGAGRRVRLRHPGPRAAARRGERTGRAVAARRGRDLDGDHAGVRLGGPALVRRTATSSRHRRAAGRGHRRPGPPRAGRRVRPGRLDGL
ncbi:MAG: monovalent cation:proton antiporter-2 (CPA2) family protein [Rhodovibrio sp.]|nr:monovalent cation:proton antiporter-2 (CPA2) family protein [Rhodovibrio sp.]